MTLGEEFSVLGNWFLIHFTENNGMAFGLEFAGEFGKLSLSIFRIIAIIAIGYYLITLVKNQEHKGLIVSLSLVFAGAMGNIIDSAFYGFIFSESTYTQIASAFPEGGGYSSFLHGKVVDMFYFPVYVNVLPDWVPIWGGQHIVFFRPVFNVADSSITIGVFSLILFQKRFFKKSPVKKEEQNEDTYLTKEPEDTPSFDQNP